MESTPEEQNSQKSNYVKGACDKKQRLISKSKAKQTSSDDAEDSSADRSAKSDQSRYRPHYGERKDVRGQSHNQAGPGLLTEKCNTEQQQRPPNGHMRHKHHHRHKQCAQAQ